MKLNSLSVNGWFGVKGGGGWEMVGPTKSPMELHSTKTKEGVQFMQHNKQKRNKKNKSKAIHKRC